RARRLRRAGPTVRAAAPRTRRAPCSMVARRSRSGITTSSPAAKRSVRYALYAFGGRVQRLVLSQLVRLMFLICQSQNSDCSLNYHNKNNGSDDQVRLASIQPIHQNSRDDYAEIDNHIV